MCQYFLQSTYSQIKIINLQKTIAFFVFLWYHNLRWVYAGVLELADEVDSKSIGSNTVRVRPPPPAPRKNELLSTKTKLVLSSFSGVKTP